MSSSINKVILVGNLGANPEYREFENGDKLCTLSIATNTTWKDKTTSEWREITQWHRVVVRASNLVAKCERSLSKGTKIYIEGMLETRMWENSPGNPNYRTEVVLRPYKSDLKVLQAVGSNVTRNVSPYSTVTQKIDDISVPF